MLLQAEAARKWAAGWGPHPPCSQPPWGTMGGGDAGESDGGWALGPGEEGRKEGL